MEEKDVFQRALEILWQHAVDKQFPGVVVSAIKIPDSEEKGGN